MDASDVSNNSFELSITPSRKRKRKFKHFELEPQNDITATETTSCFTNAAFSSTPKKILAKRRIPKKNKENETIFPNVGLEVKSVSEIAKHLEGSNQILQNPYEVLRKPPKKKCHTEKLICFENAALNLELPEKLFNPFEVVRESTSNNTSKCFSNPALNLKVQDVSVLCNPFEVQREAQNHDLLKLQRKTDDNTILLNPFKLSPEVDTRQGVLTTRPCKLTLGLPFVPRVGCRIDFKDICVSQLTPSKLLAEKLVFSPVSKTKVTLGSIGEESTTDIGKELDRYQLELENSINEEKLRKTGEFRNDIFLLSPPDTNYQIKIVDTEKSKYTKKLCGIPEDGEHEEITEGITKQKERNIEVQEEKAIEKIEIFMPENNQFRMDLYKQYQRTATAEVIEIENIDELYGSSVDNQENEDSFDFKTPAPFARAYTKPNATVTASKKPLECNISDKSGELDDHVKESMNVKNIIRKSIRKLMHSHHYGKQHQTETKDDSAEKREHEKNNGFMNTIRQSLRRKPVRNFDKDPIIKECEISIIDCTERSTKLKSDVFPTEYVKIEDLTNERKHNIRNNRFLKSVFHKKHEKYNFNK